MLYNMFQFSVKCFLSLYCLNPVLNLKVNRYWNIWNSQLFLQIKQCSPHVQQHLFPIWQCAHRYVNYTPFHSIITLVVWDFSKLPAHEIMFRTQPPMTNVLATFLSRCCLNQWGWMAPKFDSCLCPYIFCRSCVIVLETTISDYCFDIDTTYKMFLSRKFLC